MLLRAPSSGSGRVRGEPAQPSLAGLQGLVRLPAPAGTRVWRLEFNLLRGNLEALVPLLPVAERERCLQYRRPVDRLRHALCRVVLRQLLAPRLDCAPQEVAIEIDELGRPRLAQPCGLDFNLSHAGRCALIALSRGGAVGVDIERISPALKPDLMRTAFSPQELDYCAARATPRDWHKVWCGKEAVLKALGLGIAQHMPDVSVIPVRRQRYVVDLRLAAAAAAVQAWQLPAPAGFVAALARQAGPA